VTLHVDAARLTHELQVLATFSAAPAPAVTRVVFTEPDRAARAYVRSLCTASGLSLREDAVGNLFARWAGDDPALPAVCTGSHIDAIPNAGMYDGTVGVLGALEAIRALQAASLRPRRSIELLMFTSEEPTRFGIGCLGSRLLSGLGLRDSPAIWRMSRSRQVTTPRSWSCTSSRARYSSNAASASA
jgi:ureidoglycolate amidohydrolase